MSKILCIGHITLDTFLRVEDAEVHCDVNNVDCKVSFGFGEKIPVKEIHYAVGGGAANTAVGLTRLGHQTFISSTLGNDNKGKDLLTELLGHMVETKYIEHDSNPTDQASIVTYGPERTIFTYSYPRKYSIANVKENFSSIYLSSVGIDVGALYQEIIQLKEKGDIKTIFYNAGSREIKFSRDEMTEMLKYVDHLIVNVEEGCAILNPGLKRSDIEIEDLMDLLNEKGPKNIVLTDSDNGSYSWSESTAELLHLPAIKTDVVEKTGAGDAYAAGYIAATLYGYDIKKASEFGTQNASNVIKTLGAQKGLLQKEDLIKSLGDLPQ